MTSRRSFLERTQLWGFISLSLIIVIYFITRIFNFAYGPIISIKSPKPGEIIKAETFFVEGNAKNVKNISINGKDITINQDGDFKEEVIAKAPYTLVIIEAVDKYNKTKEEVLEVGKE
ncbi:MAG: hypothetical protein WCO35_00775 [Candidatus Nomurabacteria bacterium]